MSCQRNAAAVRVSMALVVRGAAGSTDGGPGHNRAQEQRGHRLTAVAVAGGTDLVLAALPAVAQPQTDHPSSRAGCRASTSTGDHRR